MPEGAATDERRKPIASLIAFADFGCGTAATLDAMMSVHAAVAVGLGVTYLRLLGEGDAPLPDESRLPKGVHLVEHRPTMVDQSGPVMPIVEAVGLTVVEVGNVRLDALAQLKPLVLVVGVGDTFLDERRAASALGKHRARAFGELRLLRRVRFRLPPDKDEPRFLNAIGIGQAVEVVPVTSPYLRPEDANALVTGTPPAIVAATGRRLLDSIGTSLANPEKRLLEQCRNGAASTEGLNGTPFGYAVGECDTLRALAHDLETIAAGVGPTASELADAPLLQGWDLDIRTVRSLSGVVDGHPRLPPGRRVRTSELFATDGRTWARTLSRYYRLGTRRPAAHAVKLH